MVTCTRCGQQVDETVRTTCPLCFTPLPAPGAAAAAPPELPEMPQPGGLAGPVAPPPPPAVSGIPGVPAQPTPLAGGSPTGYGQSAPQPSGIPGIYTQPTNPAPPVSPRAPGARVSLTGEVVDPGAPAGPPPSYVGAPLPSGPSHSPGPYAPPSGYAPGRRMEMQAPAKSGGGAAAAIIVVLLLVVGGVGGWWVMMHRTNPKDQALAAYQAIVKQDWKGLYPLLALSDEAKKEVPDADTFAQKNQQALDQASQNPIVKMLLDMMKNNMSDISTGEPTINGDKADVPTSAKLTISGRSITFKGTAHMINQWGVWKLDATAAGDFASGQQIGQDLIGKPQGVPGGFGGMGGGFGGFPR